MGYLVKASYNAEPRSYALAGIQTDVKAGLLPLTAMVREEKQDFWYSVGELIGEKPTEAFKFLCHHCKSSIDSRKIDIGLTVKCGRCKTESTVPDMEALKKAALERGKPKESKVLFYFGAVSALIGIVGTLFNWMSHGEAQLTSGLFGVLTVCGVIALRFSKLARYQNQTQLIRRKK